MPDINPETLLSWANTARIRSHQSEWRLEAGRELARHLALVLVSDALNVQQRLPPRRMIRHEG